VKIYLSYNGQRIAKKKTHIKKRTLNPVFNESFIFDLPSSSAADSLSPSSGQHQYGGVLAGISLEMVVLDYDQMTKNEVIGRVEIGANSGDTESCHWAEVVSYPRKQIASWHHLKD
jgi:Ca2+-dependent lipid-binding protein